MVDKNRDKARALVLLSGGLDSRLAVKILQDQLGEENVEALFFILPFGGGCCSDRHCVFKFCQKNNVKLHINNCQEGQLFNEYMDLIKNPAHQRGSCLNPCIDCHLFMLKKAKKLLGDEGLDFIATGEVLGERPLSQRKKPMQKIEREAGLEGQVLRPLSAKVLPKTEPEKNNLVNRGKLSGIKGRGRKKQMELAKKYRIDYPQPAGGCLLCEKGYVEKLKPILDKPGLKYKDIALLSVGRHFAASQIILGKNEDENKKLQKEKGIKLIPKQPGPTALIRPWKKDAKKESLIERAKKLIQDYTKHNIKDIENKE